MSKKTREYVSGHTARLPAGPKWGAAIMRLALPVDSPPHPPLTDEWPSVKRVQPTARTHVLMGLLSATCSRLIIDDNNNEDEEEEEVKGKTM